MQNGAGEIVHQHLVRVSFDALHFRHHRQVRPDGDFRQHDQRGAEGRIFLGENLRSRPGQDFESLVPLAGKQRHPHASAKRRQLAIDRVAQQLGVEFVVGLIGQDPMHERRTLDPLCRRRLGANDVGVMRDVGAGGKSRTGLAQHLKESRSDAAPRLHKVGAGVFPGLQSVRDRHPANRCVGVDKRIAQQDGPVPTHQLAKFLAGVAETMRVGLGRMRVNDLGIHFNPGNRSVETDDARRALS